MRSAATSSGTVSSGGSLVAGVPSRNEKMKVNASANPTSRTALSVSAKSSSVSPGNPTMTSVVSERSGMASRRRATQSRYCSRV